MFEQFFAAIYCTQLIPIYENLNVKDTNINNFAVIENLLNIGNQNVIRAQIVDLLDENTYFT